jgi:surface protein
MCTISALAQEAYAVFTPDNTTLTFYYDTQRSSRPGTSFDITEENAYPSWAFDSDALSATQAVFDASFTGFRPTNTVYWFGSMIQLQSISGMEYFITSEVTDMSEMFLGCSSLTSLDLSHFNTAKVRNMNNMFFRCKSLTSLDVSSFNTEQVTDMSSLFFECQSLTRLDVSSFNTEQVTDMSWMFSTCSELTKLDVSNFNTEQVTDMSGLFSGLDNVTTIYAGNNWSTAAVTNSIAMFDNSYNLVGGMGTTYDWEHTDAEYAHIDGGPSNPGYFTALQPYVPGDADGDGVVGVNDVTVIIDAIMYNDYSSIDIEAADLDGDGNITINDIVILIDYILTGEWP